LFWGLLVAAGGWFWISGNTGGRERGAEVRKAEQVEGMRKGGGGRAGVDSTNSILKSENQDIGEGGAPANGPAVLPAGGSGKSGKLPLAPALPGPTHSGAKRSEKGRTIDPGSRPPGDQAANSGLDVPAAEKTAENTARPLEGGGTLPFADSVQALLAANTGFAGLPVSPELLELPARNPDLPSVEAHQPVIHPLRDRKFSFGFALAGTLSKESPDGKRLGAVGGGFIQYKLNPSWSVATGLQWRFLAGAWAEDTALSMSQQLQYDFGFKKDLWTLETRGLHILEAPLGLLWRRDAWAVEGGFSPGFLIGVQGRLSREHSESLQNGVDTDRSAVWLDKTPYYQFIPGFFIGGEYQPAPWLGLTLRGAYRPGAVGPRLTDTPPPANLFWLDAGLRWYIK
jgi:hypothetical protein